MKTFLAAGIGVLLFALPARAELVYFGTGRTMSVKSHRIEGDMLVLTLRTGGEMATEPSVVAYIMPDEVPYPEPEAEAPKADATGAAATGNGAGGVQVPDFGARFAPIIDQISAKHGVDANLVRAVIKVESAYQEHARSRKGAMGLMQLMPATARQYGVSDPYDARSNIEGGIRYLKSLLEQFEPKLALAAYNAGEAAVRRFGGIPPYPETRNYVNRILDLVGR
jgi:soluble lytic murein transglycosylase-like protein